MRRSIAEEKKINQKYKSTKRSKISNDTEKKNKKKQPRVRVPISHINQIKK